MERNQADNSHAENSSNHSGMREKEKKNKADYQYTNLYSTLIDALSTEKPDTDRIKALILLEQDVMIINDKSK